MFNGIPITRNRTKNAITIVRVADIVVFSNVFNSSNSEESESSNLKNELEDEEDDQSKLISSPILAVLIL